MNAYFNSETFEKIDFTATKIQKGEYDNCIFKECDFSKIHASNIQFIECEFVDCNFSNTVITNTAFKDIRFLNCKLLGVKFNECDAFLLQFYFKGCQLNFSSFYKLKIQQTHFVNCSLQEVDFTATNLSESLFDHCDLKNAVFEDTNLEKVDFRTSVGFSMNPNENKLKGAKFNRASIDGLLSGFKIVIE